MTPGVWQAPATLTAPRCHVRWTVRQTRSTNSVDDAIEGVSIELTNTTTGTETITVARDVDSAVSKVQKLVDSYNSLLDRIDGYQAYDVEKETGGLLSGDYRLNTLVDELRRTLTGAITGMNGGISLISGIGITADGYDHLSVDTAVLKTALQSDPDMVGKMFGLDWTSSSTDITYVSSTDATADSGLSGFSVNITQVATKTVATSASLAGITVD